MTGKATPDSEVGEARLLEALRGIDWPIRYGEVKVRIKNGEVDLVTIEKTIPVYRFSRGDLALEKPIE